MVTPELLKEAGLVKQVKDGIKILGDGALNNSITVKANKFTTICAGIGSFLFGIPPILGYNVWDKATLGGMTILDMMDFATNSILMPICALLTCIFVAYVIGVNSIHDEVRISSAFKRQKLFDIMIKYVAPVFIVAILISSILEALGIIKF